MRQAYRFLFKLTLFWVILFAAWLILGAPYYGRLLAVGTNLLFERNPFNNDRATLEYVHPRIVGSIEFDLKSLTDDRSGRGDLRFSLEGRRFHFNATIWFALMLATPGWKHWRTRVIYLLGGWALLFLCQDIDLFMQMENHKLVHMQSPEFMGLYHAAGTMDYLLGSLGKYFFLLGRFVVPIALWLPCGVKAFRSENSR